MFLQQRSTQPEYFDLPGRTEAEIAASFYDLNRVNRLFRFSHPFETVLPQWLGQVNCERLEILDVGAGTGLLGKTLTEWARRQGWHWRFTNLDTNPFALKIGNLPDGVVGSALQLPFANGSFDLVVASQMTHHLTDEQVVTHWREAWRVTRDAIFICDLHRNVGLYTLVWLALHLMRADKTVREDGLTSVRRGFRRNEWRELAGLAGIPRANIWRYHGTRIVLQARKKHRKSVVRQINRSGGRHKVFTPLVASRRSAYYHSPVSSHGYFPKESELALNGAAQLAFHERAAAVTRKEFGKDVFVRAVVEVSNFCRENCGYCGMRRDNRSLDRYRAKTEQIAELLIQHRPPSVTDVNIQTGEDPVAVREVVLPLIETLRRETSLGISVCLGTLSPELYAELQAAGASIFIMKFELGDAAQYEQFEAPGTLTERLRHIRLLAENNWKVSSGFIAGLPGQTPRDLLKNLELAQSLPLSGCSVSPFIPGDDTPLAKNSTANPDWTFNCVSALRLMRPDWVIPAVSAFNLAAQDGYRRGLSAGANLVTINMTPTDQRGDYVIYKRDRFIMTEERVLTAIAAEGLAPSKVGLADFYRDKKGNGVMAEKVSGTVMQS